MNRRDLTLIMMASCILSASPAYLQAQRTASDSIGDEPSYLFRLERRRSLEDVCVLVRGDGRYHLEHHALEKVKVFEGTVDSGDLVKLVHIVSSDQLFTLRQKQVPDSMMMSDDDHLMLAVLRPVDVWQQLSFPDSHSREPYRESLVPLVEWLDRVQKLKAQKLSEEEGRNNCLPFAKPELSTRVEKGQEPHVSASANLWATSNGPEPGERARQESDNYILRMEESGVIHGIVTMTCTLILNSGDYHFVKQSREPGSRKVRSIVLDGILNTTQISLLRQLLRDPLLQNSPSGPQTSGVYIPVDGLAIASIWMPHDGTIQKFQAWRELQVVAGWRSNAVADHGMKTLAPLQQWLKVNLNESKAVAVPSPQNANCLP